MTTRLARQQRSVSVELLNRQWVWSTTRLAFLVSVLALCSRFTIPLPFTPVPVSLAPQAVCSLALLQSHQAFGAVGLLLLGGIAGLPLFSGGSMGLVHLLGPCGGYLAGYLLVALIARFAGLEKWAHRKTIFFAALVLGSALILGCGFLRLVPLLGFQKAWFLGVQPFLIGDFLIKCPLFALFHTAASPRLRAAKGARSGL